MNNNRLKRFKDSIYLTGFMATGKSTLGRLLAKQTGMSFVDLDNYIEEKEYQTVSTIFKERGEAEFRRLEWQYLLELTRTYTGIVSLGGGALQNQRVVDHLKVHGLLVFIDTPMEDIYERVMRNTRRPIRFDEQGNLKSGEVLLDDLKRLYSERKSFYSQAQIRMKGNNEADTYEQVLKLLKKIEQHV